MTDPKSYAQAGVSLETADAVVERLRTAVESTGARGFGAFAGLHLLDDGRLLAASTDGVGTKLILGRERGRLRDCGADLAAHCINDVITTGATPLMLLDYVAAAEIRLEDVAELVEGAAAVCRDAAVPPNGPLPGAYRRTALPALERALAAGRLALRDAIVELDVATVNPSAFVSMAFRGTGLYPEPLPLRVLATMPSLDVMLFAVSERTGLKSLMTPRRGKTRWRRRKAGRSGRSMTTGSGSTASRSRWCWGRNGRSRATPLR